MYVDVAAGLPGRRSVILTCDCGRVWEAVSRAMRQHSGGEQPFRSHCQREHHKNKGWYRSGIYSGHAAVESRRHIQTAGSTYKL